MLTADLLDFRRRQGRLVPRLLDPGAAPLCAAAEALTACVQAHVGRPRGELDEALRAAEFPGVSAKTLLALVRLLLEQCSFDVVAHADPAALRAAVFDAAAVAWQAGAASRPAAAVPGTEAWRQPVLGRAAAVLGAATDALEALDAALFADLEENQRLTALAPLAPAALLYRHNTAQVQGLLLRAERLTLTSPWPDARRLRQLLRYLKFFGLLFRQEPPTPDGSLHLSVDGPLSVLESGTRYGLQLAQFFPALLLWPVPWRLEAPVRPGKSRAEATLVVEPHPWLRSHYPDHGQWVGADVLRFVEAFNAGRQGGRPAAGRSSGQSRSPWLAEPAEALLMLADNRFLVPDFVFQRPGAAPLHLEHLPYPDAGQVQTRMDMLAAAGRTDYLLAARAVPSLKPLEARYPQLVLYRRSLLPTLVREALARCSP